MPENKSREKPTVTLEQLLHVKRSERPEQSFWEEFDRELRRRQLATVVNNRPWYSRFAETSMWVLRRSAPFGAAAAALAAGFVIFDHSDSDPVGMKVEPAQIAQTSPENLLVVLPAEQFASRAQLARASETESSLPVQREFSQPQFVVHQFELPPAPSRPWKTVASTNMLTVSGTAMSEDFENVGRSTGPALRAPGNPGAGSF